MCEHGHSHDHDKAAVDPGIEFSLYQKIDMDKVTCLNEVREGSGRTVFKSWDKRLDKSLFVSSDADEELLFNIPFTGMVKLKGVIVIGGENASHPNKMRLFKDKPQMDFDVAALPADQEFEMFRDETGHLEYAVRVVKFASISHLSIHFPSNFGADATKIYYIGLRGEFSEARRREAVVAIYEASALPQDHKAEIPDAARYGVF